MRRFPVWCLALVVPLAGTACGGGTEPDAPGSVVLVSGDGQEGIRGGPLAQPVIVRVLRTNGQPLPNAEVRFFAQNAVFATDTSDAAGLAEVIWTLPTQTGDHEMRVLVEGTAPLIVTAASLDPCFVDVPYSMAQAASGELTTLDCVILQAYVDFFEFAFPGGSGIFTQTASPMDPFLMLVDGQNNILAFNDDDPAGGTNSVLRAFMVAGTYRVAPTSFLSLVTGSYQIGSQQGGTDVAGCEEVWIVRGTTVTQTIASTDCAGSGFYSDQYGMIVMPGQTVQITLRSTAVDAFLAVLNGNTGAVITNDNAPGLGTDARITISNPPQITLFVIDAGTADTAEVGAYTLSLLAPGTGPVAGSAVPLTAQVRDLKPQHDRLRRLRSTVFSALRR